MIAIRICAVKVKCPRSIRDCTGTIPTMFSKGFFKTLLPPLTQSRKQIQLQLGHVTFLGLTEKC